MSRERSLFLGESVLVPWASLELGYAGLSSGVGLRSIYGWNGGISGRVSCCRRDYCAPSPIVAFSKQLSRLKSTEAGGRLSKKTLSVAFPSHRLAV